MLEYSVLFPEVKKKTAFLFGDNISLSYPCQTSSTASGWKNSSSTPVSANPRRSRPFGLLTVSAETGGVLTYQDCRLEDFVDSGQHPADEKISYALPKKIRVKEFKLEQSLLEKMYEMVRVIAFAESLTEQQQQVLHKYWVVFEKAVPVDLMPYYQAMGQKFFEWGVEHV